MRCTQWPTSASGSGIRNCDFRPAIDRLPGFAAIVGAERAGRRDGDENAVRIFRIEQDRVQAHAAGAGLPEMTFGAAQAGQFLPASCRRRSF